MSGSISDLQYSAMIAKQLGFDSYRTNSDGDVILYTVREMGKAGRIYIGFIPSQDNLYIATVKAGENQPQYKDKTVFYNDRFPFDGRCSENDDDDDYNTYYDGVSSDDLLQFVKQTIVDYYSNLFD